MTRPLDQPPYSTSCTACADGERWLWVPEGEQLTGDEEVIRLCPQHVEIVQGKPGWRRALREQLLPGAPLETHEVMTVVAYRLEDTVPQSPIPQSLRKQLAAVFRDTARTVTLAGRTDGSPAGSYVERQFDPLLRLAELAWELDMPPAGRGGNLSPEAIRRIAEASPVVLPPGVAGLLGVDPNPQPQAGELWRVGRDEAMLAWVRTAFADGVLDVIPVTMDAEMADHTSLLISTGSTPLELPLAALTSIRTPLPRSVFLSRICALDIEKEIEEVISAERAGRLPVGVWVGPALTEADDERVTFQQELMALLSTWAPSPERKRTRRTP